MRIPYSTYHGARIYVLYAIILVLGFFWCKDVLGRLSEDIQTMKESTDTAEKWVVVFYWVITAVIMTLMITIAWSLIAKFIDL